MGSSDLTSLLDECIKEQQAGSNLEEILARYPKYARELRPLLETAAWTKNARESILIPGNAQSLSRKAFTSLQTTQQNKPALHTFNLRLALSFTVIILCLVFGLLGTTIASAHALPGDTLYPVKLTWEQIQISLTSGTAQRLHLQQIFDRQRVEEVQKLINLGRSSTVNFSGVLAGSNNTWNVAGIDLNVDDQQAGKLPNLQNTVVEVKGKTNGKSVKVSDIEPHLVTINGQIQEINPDHVQVNGVNVTLDKNTDVDGQLSIDQQVQITARQEDDGEFVAVNVNGEQTAKSTPSNQSSPANKPNSGSEKSSPPQKSPQPTEEENAPTPASGIQPMMTSPTPAGAGEEPEKGPGSSRASPTPTPTSSIQSNHEGENQPMSTPTPVPSSEKIDPTATGTPTED